MSLWKKSAVELAKGLRDGDYSAEEVMADTLARIESVNPALNALVETYPDKALAQARDADARRAKGDDPRPLEGIPISIKVNVDVAGLANTNGLPALKDNIASNDAPVVANLKNAGAILVGRSNTPELSMRGTTDNPLYGLTHSPWDNRASPGGSSGGAGAACAAGMGPIHHGNDIAGSLRFPASACGCATLKPGLGRVAAFNPSATAERGLLAQLMSVQGAICREVKDVRLATQIMAQADPRDPWWAPVPFNGPEIKDLRIAFTKETHGYNIHPDILAGLDEAALMLRDAGYMVEEVSVPSILPAAEAWFSVAIREVKDSLDPIAQEYGSETIQRIFDYYYQMSDMVDQSGYIAGIADRTRLVRDWNVFLAEYPLILTPFLMRPTYDVDYDETFAGCKDIFDSAIYSYGINYMGLPAGNVPLGLVEGRPAGLQIVGQRFREDLILNALEAIEDRTGTLTQTLWQREEI